MRFRLAFLIITAFFVTMNVLLWRSEYGARGQFGAPVPAELVWEKVLTSPDNSHLEIRHHGMKVGRAHWVATISEAMATGKIIDEMPPEGMVKAPTGYTIDFDGTISMDDLSRLRFSCHLELNTNQNWQAFSVKLTLKPFSWEIVASNATRSVKFTADDGERLIERTFTEADLRHPDKLVREIGGGAAPAMLAALGVPLRPPGAGAESFRLNWEASSDRLKIGNNLVRVYRIETRLLERLKMVLFVSPVGELLRVDLPDEIILTNDALLNI